VNPRSEESISTAGSAGDNLADGPASPGQATIGLYARWIAAALSASAGAVHLGYAPHHLEEDWAHGWFFIAIGAAQIAFAILFVNRPRRWVWTSAIALNLGIAATWAVSRSIGLPFGPESLRNETVSTPDVVCVVLGMGVVALAALALFAPRFMDRPVRDRIGTGAVTGFVSAAAIIVGAVMLTPTYTSAHASGGHGHEGATALTGTTACELSGPAASPGQVALDAEGHSHRGPTEQIALTENERVELAAQQVLARDAALRYPTVADAEAAGYRMSVAYVPCIGAHYTNIRYTISFDPAHPSELLYDGTMPTSKIVGLSYLVWSPGGEPTGFAGPNDRWHQHNSNGGLCTKGMVVVGGEALSNDECRALGGRKNTLDSVWMLHDWVVPGWECSWGAFAGECPELGGRTGGTAWDAPDPGSSGAALTGLATN
jgi:hypothetical protein